MSHAHGPVNSISPYLQERERERITCIQTPPRTHTYTVTHTRAPICTCSHHTLNHKIQSGKQQREVTAAAELRNYCYRSHELWTYWTEMILSVLVDIWMQQGYKHWLPCWTWPKILFVQGADLVRNASVTFESYRSSVWCSDEALINFT